MRSAYSAGFLYTLGARLNITTPNIIVAASGSAGASLYFATHQYEANKRIWTQLLSTTRFIFLPRLWRIMNIDYLVDVVFKQQELFNESSLKQSPTAIFVAVRNVDTGQTEFLDATRSPEPLELLRATKAIPILYRKTVRLGGKTYIDGGVGLKTQTMLDKVLQMGAKRILFINETSPAGIWRFFGLQETSIDNLLYPSDVNLLYLKPGKLPARRMTRSKVRLSETFDRGVRDALARAEELRTLLA
ncbi:hypothetical protein A3C18_01800 [Candidatus Kaiserbacteria bacterium RIFCSPHIGHO2_02_FULL_54_11b]|uniref:PNPLA domain-containing protein n=2 Tax=Candidatus Kaiseribacteriota TaxID=1752734 RepID=A0A1F6CS53_9BACT|nr:MAG: hypothetical protein A2704_00285 [Candidatus Kaiserbacteria bacterium RIFCSPHIGHO2_01_FULL_54_36b]OGG64984.1 MAG: hypothetical protein A3C18_01800 [Candidatus Kaiserbacteria bacterium RIFCSPHIGHO2_02_FULL_54_11b]